MNTMTKSLRRPREIIDRKDIASQLDDTVARDLTPQEVRKNLLSVLKMAFRKGHNEVRRRCLNGGRVNGAVTVRENCYLMDQILLILCDFVTTHVYAAGVRTKGEKISLLAVGGYGRGELSPYSDVDLLFLLPYKTTPHSEQVVEYMLYILWDLGLKVGHASRSIDECLRLSKKDTTVRTALLEARWLWGDQTLASDFKQRFRNDVTSGSPLAFVEAKLAERDARHSRLGDSRYLLEPNVKEDKGGVRDLHTLFWIAKYLYDIHDIRELVGLGLLSQETALRFIKAQTFLWSVRCLLHYLTNRGEDRLTFDMQKDIANHLGYTDHTGAVGVERFMKHYFLIAKDVGDLTRIFCAVLEEHNKRKPRLHRHKEVEGCFVIDGNRLGLKKNCTFAQDPLRILMVFRLAQTRDLDIHPHTLRHIHENLKLVTPLRNSPQANALFLEILCDRQDPESNLRRMNEAGVLGRFLPDFGKVVAQMQYDMYHVYTTDEHTIRAIGIAHRIDLGLLAEELPLSTDIFPTIQSRRALFVAVMLHDIAKGRGGDHSILGAKLALSICPRLGLAPEETETVSWLVEHHLAMSRTAFKRDMDDPQTIIQFAHLVQSPERLKLLLILTCADIRAVGPNVWNGWKAALLRALYHRTVAALSGGLSAEDPNQGVAQKKAALRERLSDWSEDDITQHLALGFPSYWCLYDTDTHQKHAVMMRTMMRNGLETNCPLTIDLDPDPAHDILTVTVLCPDHPGVFSRISGAMSLVGCTIVDAKIITLTNSMALDTFTVQDPRGELPVSDDKQDRLQKTIEDVLTSRRNLAKALAQKTGVLPQRARVFTVPPRIIVDNSASKAHTVIEINGRDRPGFLYDVTRTLTDLAVQINSAHISTYGERVVDVFYIKDIFGMKIDHQGKLEQMRERLKHVLVDCF